MKKMIFTMILFTSFQVAVFAQMPAPQIDGKEVYKGEDVVFHQIDEHTWIGSGHVMASESLYLVEETTKLF